MGENGRADASGPAPVRAREKAAPFLGVLAHILSRVPRRARLLFPSAGKAGRQQAAQENFALGNWIFATYLLRTGAV